MSLVIYEEGDSIFLLNEGEGKLTPLRCVEEDIERYGRKLGFEGLTINRLNDESGEATNYYIASGKGALTGQREDDGVVVLDKAILTKIDSSLDLPTFVMKQLI